MRPSCLGLGTVGSSPVHYPAQSDRSATRKWVKYPAASHNEPSFLLVFSDRTVFTVPFCNCNSTVRGIWVLSSSSSYANPHPPHPQRARVYGCGKECPICRQEHQYPAAAIRIPSADAAPCKAGCGAHNCAEQQDGKYVTPRSTSLLASRCH